MKTCKKCGKQILRKVGEYPSAYKRKQYCDNICRMKMLKEDMNYGKI